MYHRPGLVPRQLYVYNRGRDMPALLLPKKSRSAICNPGDKRDDEMMLLIGLDRAVSLISQCVDR